MTTIKTNKESLERIFAGLEKLVKEEGAESLFINKQIEYAYSVMNNELSRNAFLALYRNKLISEETFKSLPYWLLFNAETDNTRKLRYVDDFWKTRRIKDDFSLIEKVHYKILEKLDQLEANYQVKNAEQNDAVVAYIYSPESGIGKLQLNGKVLSFKKRNAALIEVFYKNRGGIWLAAGEGELINQKPRTLLNKINAINRRIDKEVGIYPLIAVREKPKHNPRQKGEYRFAL